jgi:hypothetical protein
MSDCTQIAPSVFSALANIVREKTKKDVRTMMKDVEFAA